MDESVSGVIETISSSLLQARRPNSGPQMRSGDSFTIRNHWYGIARVHFGGSNSVPLWAISLGTADRLSARNDHINRPARLGPTSLWGPGSQTQLSTSVR